MEFLLLLIISGYDSPFLINGKIEGKTLQIKLLFEWKYRHGCEGAFRIQAHVIVADLH